MITNKEKSAKEFAFETKIPDKCLLILFALDIHHLIKIKVSQFVTRMNKQADENIFRL